MRVTKLIREHVETEVGKVYSAKIEAAGAEYYKERDQLEEKLEAIVEEANNKVIALVESEGFEVSNAWSHKNAVSLTCTIKKQAEEEKISKERRELKEKKNEIIKDILLSLELGEVTKAELTQLLNEVK